MKVKVDREHSSSLSNVASILISSINQVGLSRRLQQYPAVVPLTFVQPELYGMKSIKRVFSKSKKSTSGQDVSPSPPAKPKNYLRRRSRSLTLPRKSYRTDGSQEPLEAVSPTRTKRRIKTSDIKLVLDISPENAAKLAKHSRYQSTDEQSDVTSDDCLTDDQFARPRTPPLLIDQQLLDQFPTPPQIHAYSSPDVRIPILNTDYGLPPGEILPPPTPQLQQYIIEQKAAASVRRQPLSRSSSNASFSRPTATAYSDLYQSNRSVEQFNHRAYPPSTTLTRPSYRTHHNNLSTRSLGTEMIYRPGPSTHRPIVHQQSRSDLGPSARPHYVRPSTAPSADVAAGSRGFGIERKRGHVVEPLRTRATSTRSRTVPQ